MDKQNAICEYLKQHHTGLENAVHSEELERLFLIDRRGLQRKISRLRKEGVPICSGESGYYYAKDQREVNAMVSKLNCCVTAFSNARNGMLFASASPQEAPVIEIRIMIDRGGYHAE